MSQRLKVLLLLFFFALCGAAILGTYFAHQRLPAPAARELYSIVHRQLSALHANDFDSAYRNAASGVQQKFSRAQFELMIRRDFPSLQEAARVEFGDVEVAGGTAIARVFIIAPDGTVRAYLYSFTAEDGGWKIDGVQPLGPQPVDRLGGLHV
jgi:hypothetical protein